MRTTTRHQPPSDNAKEKMPCIGIASPDDSRFMPISGFAVGFTAITTCVTASPPVKFFRIIQHRTRSSWPRRPAVWRNHSSFNQKQKEMRRRKWLWISEGRNIELEARGRRMKRNSSQTADVMIISDWWYDDAMPQQKQLQHCTAAANDKTPYDNEHSH